MSADTKRDREFYIELVFVTAVALSIANIWVDLLMKWMHMIFPSSFIFEVAYAVGLTFLGVFVLHKMFGDKKDTLKSKGLKNIILPHRI